MAVQPDTSLDDPLGPAHLRLVVAVVDTGSITGAATALGQSQPAASAMLRRIEERVGGELFVRSPSGSRVTVLGRHLVAHGRVLLADYDELNHSIGLLAERPPHPSSPLVGSPLRIGCQAGPVATEFAAILPAVVGLPEMAITVDASHDLLSDGLRGGDLDLALLSRPTGFRPRIPPKVRCRTVVAREPAFVGLANGHPLARHEVISLDRLWDEDWLDDPDDDSGWSVQFRAACQAAGFEPRVRYRGINPILATRLVREGNAVAMFFPTAPARTGMVMRRVLGDPMTSDLVLAWRPGAEFVVDRLWRELRLLYRAMLARAPHVARWLPTGDRIDLLPCGAP